MCFSERKDGGGLGREGKGEKKGLLDRLGCCCGSGRRGGRRRSCSDSSLLLI